MHPYELVKDFVWRNPNIHTLNFSYYHYIKSSVSDYRYNFSVGRNDFLLYGIEYLTNSIPLHHELAFHSNIILHDGTVSHMPLFDMATEAQGQLFLLKKVLPDSLYNTITWFNSGRSFHGYSELLVSESDWVKIMGSLLLANQKGLKPIVDPRWIGHRLLGGYSALRWTRRTSDYIIEPTSINLK